ncbi:MAG: VCBS repeat-containing protein [Verrucomicrobia bacterium]|nr:VCBS repeat-containing protein [Verrucomicrobiota bacterium]
MPFSHHPPARTSRRIVALLIASLALGAGARAQLTPPAQTHVAAIGSAPFRAPATAEFAPGAFLTMEGWFFLTGHTPFGWLMGKGLPTAGTDPYLAFALILNEDGTRVRFSLSTGAPGSLRDITSPSPVPLRTWTHIAAVLDGSSMRLLINGNIVASGTAAGAPPAAPSIALGVGIAYQQNGNTNFPAFAGYARHVRFWNVARTAAQIAAGAPVSLPAERAGLVAAWPLDERGGNSARDLSGANRALSGGGHWARLTVLEAGPFFDVTTLTPAGNVLADADDSVLIDFDSDGDPDLLTFHIQVPATVPETRRRIRAFRNNGGTFADVTDAVLGNVTMVHPRDRFVADFNGDGRPDLFLIGHGTDTPPFPGEQAKLLIQTADGRLVDETATRLPQRSDFTHNLALGDIDGDGDLDAFLANINGAPSTGGPRFYLNNGNGVFTEATDRLPADIANRTSGLNYTSAYLLDLNGDGRAELVLGGGDLAPTNEILINDGTGRFSRNSRYTLPPKLFGPKASTVAITAADLNADGAPDLLFSTTGGTILMPDGRTIDGYGLPGVQLLLNRGDGTFYDATSQLNLTFGPTDTWVEWIRTVDLNRDGRLDLVLQGAPNDTGAPFSRTLLLNRGGALFVDASEAYSAPTTTSLHPADLNRDGLIDLVGINSQSIVVARATKVIDRALFQTDADAPGRLANLSVRTQAGTGDQTLITGFALSGAGTKPLLVRAIGPTLGAFGLTGTLADPLVEIAPLNAAKVADNNDWSGTAALKAAFGAVGAFPLAPDSSKDAALVFSPGAGAYTARVTGSDGGTGVALVEVYDTGSGNTPKLTNLSARTQVGTGADALIAGFVVNGNVPKKLLLRAVGPTLGAFGVGGTLADPVLEVRPLNSDNIVATNDDWRGTAALKAAFASVGAFGFANDSSQDAAIAIELPPGAYTATVSGKGGGTGVALVEVYELP